MYRVMQALTSIFLASITLQIAGVAMKANPRLFMIALAICCLATGVYITFFWRYKRNDS